MKHQIVNTSYGEVMCKESETIETMVDCFVGTNFDTYIGSIKGSIYDAPENLVKQINSML